MFLDHMFLDYFKSVQSGLNNIAYKRHTFVYIALVKCARITPKLVFFYPQSTIVCFNSYVDIEN